MSEPASRTSEPVDPAVRFEHRDASIRAIVICGAGLVVLSVLVQLFLSGILSEMAPSGPPAGPSAISQPHLQLPRDLEKVPGPRLQVNQTRNLDALHREEDAFLDRSAGWVEKDKIVHVPVAEAMRLLSDSRTVDALGIKAGKALMKSAVEGKQ